MSIKHRTGVERVLAALKLTGAAAMALSFIMMLGLAGCDTSGDDPGGGDGSFTVGALDESVPSGGTLSFYTSPYEDVYWSITTEGCHLETGIDENGKLTVAGGETKTSLEIKATSKANINKSGTKTVNVYDSVWTAVDNSAFDNIYFDSIAWGGASGQEKFVAGGDDRKMAYSPDGITWKAISDNGFTSLYEHVNGIAWGGSNSKYQPSGSSPR